MRLFWGLFLLLAAQALLVVLLPLGILLFNIDRAQQTLLHAQDAQSLNAVSAIVATQMRAGGPIGVALRAVETDMGDPTARRIALYTPDGRWIAGARIADSSTVMERPVMVGGRRVAVVRIMPARADAVPLAQALARDQLVGVLIAVALIPLTLLVSGYFIASRWSRPQIALLEASRAIAQGDSSAHLSETGPSETRATMRNLGRVARRFDRLESARRTWLVAVSEELRAPVRALRATVQHLVTPAPQTVPEGYRDILRNVRRLEELAEDLHAVALADLGRLPVVFATTDPVALIHNAVWSNGARAREQGVTLETGMVPTQTVPVTWDGRRIEQLFTALIENSLRYTPAGGRITLGLEGQRAAWHLIIDDSAPGIDVELAQHVFEPFYRTTKAPGESVLTSGLGLATAQAIVEAHHGRIEAGLSPLGGLRVTVILPGAPPIA